MLFWLFFCSVLIQTELRSTVSNLLNIHSVVLVRLTMNSSCIQYFRALFKKCVFYAYLSNEACLLYKSLVYFLKLFCPHDSQLLRKKSAFLTMWSYQTSPKTILMHSFLHSHTPPRLSAPLHFLVRHGGTKEAKAG